MKPKAVLAAALLASFVAASIFASSRTARAPAVAPHAFAMCVSRGAPPVDDTWSELVLASVARSLSLDERTALEEALSVSATRWEARANPLLDDIEDVDPDASLEAWFKSAPVFTRTARAAARLQACAPDGFCALPLHDVGCPPGWSPPSNDADAARARFIVWPWGHALRLHARSEAEARSGASSLRARIRSSTRIALVLGGDDEAATQAEPYLRLRELWKRQAILRKIARAERLEPAPDRLSKLDAREIVVLPRLETIADDAAFEAEIRAAAPELETIAR